MRFVGMEHCHLFMIATSMKTQFCFVWNRQCLFSLAHSLFLFFLTFFFSNFQIWGESVCWHSIVVSRCKWALCSWFTSLMWQLRNPFLIYFSVLKQTLLCH